MLLGTYPAKFVSGHRVAVPSSLRRGLGETFILAKWYEGSLVLTDKGSWDALLKRITGSTEMIIEPIRDTEHFIFASAYEVTPDIQGRIVIPERLLTYSGLGEDIYFLGLGDRVEIWNKEAWEVKERQVAQDAAGYIEELAKKNGK